VFEVFEAPQVCNCTVPGVIKGTPGSDFLYGTEQADIICGLGDRDFIAGLGGDDCIDGGDGNDWIYGGLGDDTIYGRAGKDVAYGHHGKDEISGNEGEDFLTGIKISGICILRATDSCRFQTSVIVVRSTRPLLSNERRRVSHLDQVLPCAAGLSGLPSSSRLRAEAMQLLQIFVPGPNANLST
jgi:hypothetical protein